MNMLTTVQVEDENKTNVFQQLVDRYVSVGNNEYRKQLKEKTLAKKNFHIGLRWQRQPGKEKVKTREELKVM